MNKRNISRLPLILPELGTWPATQFCALTGNLPRDFSVPRLALNPVSHTSQGEKFCKTNAWTAQPGYSEFLTSQKTSQQRPRELQWSGIFDQVSHSPPPPPRRCQIILAGLPSARIPLGWFSQNLPDSRCFLLVIFPRLTSPPPTPPQPWV